MNKKINLIELKQIIRNEIKKQKYIFEQEEQEEIEEKTEIPKILKVKHLKAILNYIKSERKKEALKGVVKGAAADVLLDFIPGSNTIKNAFMFFKTVAKTPDAQSKKIDFLKALDLDDRVAELVDDKIEDEFYKHLEKVYEEMPDELELDGLDMTNLLRLYIQKTYEKTKGIDVKYK